MTTATLGTQEDTARMLQVSPCLTRTVSLKTHSLFLSGFSVREAVPHSGQFWLPWSGS